LLAWTEDALASEPHVVNKLRHLRAHGESDGDVILWPLEMEAKGRR
jgi:hypothetical protein